MIRRFNYTGRKRILREQVMITVDGTKKPATFTAALSLESHHFNPDAAVIIEAYRGSSGLWMAFDWGRVVAMRAPAVGILSDFDSIDGLLFRVRVVAVHEPHKILGEADQVPFTKAGEAPSLKRPLIETRPENLGDVMWRINFDSASPELLINEAVGNWKAVPQDPIFRALVYPALLREILTRFLVIEKWSADSDNDDWRAQWLTFARKLAPGHGDLLNAEIEKQEFIDDAVSSLAAKIHARDLFIEEFNSIKD